MHRFIRWLFSNVYNDQITLFHKLGIISFVQGVPQNTRGSLIYGQKDRYRPREVILVQITDAFSYELWLRMINSHPTSWLFYGQRGQNWLSRHKTFLISEIPLRTPPKISFHFFWRYARKPEIQILKLRAQEMNRKKVFLYAY